MCTKRSILIVVLFFLISSGCTSIGRSVMSKSLKYELKLVIDTELINVKKIERKLKKGEYTLTYDFYPSDISIKDDIDMNVEINGISAGYKIVREEQARALDLSGQLTLLIPGFAVDKSLLTSYAIWFSSLGSDVIVMDLKSVDETTFSFGSKLVAYYPELSSNYKSVNVVGFSMGFLPALHIAQKYNPSNLIGVAPFLIREDLNVAASKTVSYIEYLPQGLIDKVIDSYLIENDLQKYFSDGLEVVNYYENLLVINSGKDDVLPESSKLVLKNHCAQQFFIPNYQHHLLASTPTNETTKLLVQFLGDLSRRDRNKDCSKI
ncbi:Alpha/beta hydrolase family protein (plasmid) [Pseudoalteromonas sp. NC201]|nr:Alpha/beta hydrolase family protein [Pseudoalteromonas sp. NC201]